MSKKSQIIIIATFVLAGFLVFIFSQGVFKVEKNNSILNFVLPEEIVLAGESIPLTWTDNNDNENLIIKSDRQYYDGRDSSEVYFSITNISAQDQKPDIKFLFDKKEGRGTKELVLLNSQNDVIASGQTNFYKAIIYYPQNSNGEFFIEAKGDKGGYGYLDPYYASGLVGNWTFNGQDISGTTAYDRSGQSPANNGTISGATPVPGISGQALSFSASNIKIAEPTPDVFDFTSSGGFSQFMWFKKTTACKAVDNNSNEVFATRFGTGDAANTWWFGCNVTTNVLSIEFYPSAGGGSCFGGWCLTSPGAINDGQWHYGGWVYDGSTKDLRLYLDGAMANSTTTTFSGTFDSSNPICIGGYSGSLCNTYQFGGQIDEVRVYNRALSASEITDLYKIGAARMKVNTPITQRGPQSGLVGNWTFNGPDINWSTGTAFDRSGTSPANNGTITNMSTTTSPVPGISGQALSFDGVDDYVNVGNSSSLKPSQLTVSAWFKFTPDNDYQVIIQSGNNWNDMKGYFLRITDTNVIQVAVTYATGNTAAWWTASDAINSGQWYFVVMTYDSSYTLTVYINGIAQGSPSTGTAAPLYDASNVLIGSVISPVGYTPTGKIDEVRVYNRALGASEITDLYRIGAARLKTNVSIQKAGPQSGLVGNWTFNGPDIDWSTNTAYDRSGTSPANNGAITNMSTTTSPAPGISGQALSFDGVDDYVTIGDSASLDISGNITLSAWVKYDTLAGGNTIVGKAHTSCTAPYRMWALTSGEGTKFSIETGSAGINRELDTLTSPSPNRWYYVTGTYDGINMRIYLNGVQDNFALYSGAIATNDVPALIGAHNIGGGCGNGNWDGLIDEVRVYNRALSASEITDLYKIGAARVKIRQ